MTQSPVMLLVCATLFALIPLAITLGTSYVKVSIVMGLLRQGFGTQQAPSGLVISSLSLVISVFVMRSVLDEMWQAAEKLETSKLSNATIAQLSSQLGSVAAPWKAFLLKHAGTEELFVLTALDQRSVSASDRPLVTTEPNLPVLLAAFLLTELKEAFCMGFVLLLPFLVIDIVVANLAVGLGLTMLNPSMVTLPLKILLFFYANGWLALSKGLINSYGGAS